jgi:DNA modification methylase
MADLVERFSQPGDLIVDPFVGAGTTGIAALRLKRKFIGFDNDPQAVAITQGRLADAE